MDTFVLPEGLWGHHPRGRSRPKLAPEDRSEARGATKAEGRRPMAAQRGARPPPRGPEETTPRSGPPSFGALGPVGGLLDMIYQGRRKRGREKGKGKIGRRDLYWGSNTPMAVGLANFYPKRKGAQTPPRFQPVSDLIAQDSCFFRGAARPCPRLGA